MINANVCLDPNACSNYGRFAQHVMDEHITARLVGAPHPFSCRPWRVHTWREPWPRCLGSASEDKPGISSQRAAWLRVVVEIEHDNESRALQLSYTASVKHMLWEWPCYFSALVSVVMAEGNGVQRGQETLLKPSKTSVICLYVHIFCQKRTRLMMK